MATESTHQRTAWKKHMLAALLVCAAWAIASLGRLVLDWAIQQWPTHEATVERLGGWLLGLVVVVLVLLPMLRLYSLLHRQQRRDDTR